MKKFDFVRLKKNMLSVSVTTNSLGMIVYIDKTTDVCLVEFDDMKLIQLSENDIELNCYVNRKGH